MTKKEYKARKEAYIKALKEGRVVRYDNKCCFRSFPTVAAAEAFLAEVTGVGMEANIVVA